MIDFIKLSRFKAFERLKRQRAQELEKNKTQRVQKLATQNEEWVELGKETIEIENYKWKQRGGILETEKNESKAEKKAKKLQKRPEKL